MVARDLSSDPIQMPIDNKSIFKLPAKKANFEKPEGGQFENKTRQK